MAFITQAPAGAPQHMTALAQANRTRLARAELKRAIADGSKSVVDVIADCPWEAASMAIGELLMAQHRWGQARARRFLSPIPMSEAKRVGTLTRRQRDVLCARLRGDEAADTVDLMALWRRL